METALIIPARYASSRLPGKPLIDLCGVPMIVRTYRQCAKAMPAEAVIVATDDDRIVQVLKAEGIPFLLTSGECLTGTDRLVEASRRIQADFFINVQGDEPLFDPANITLLIQAMRAHPDRVFNGFCRIDKEADFRSPSVPKVVMRPDGRLLYMSRAAIPTGKSLGFATAWRQVCAYGFPRAALEAFGAQRAKTPLEAIEDIEILRFLELGWDVQMLEMTSGSLPLDTPEDLPAILQAIRTADARDQGGARS